MSTPPPLIDIVMKGGVTSGVTYPLAVNEIAKRFHLKNLGGTSAGAIAAACAAAAEYRRRQSPACNDRSGFDVLALLPKELGAPGQLVQLFRPDSENRPLFDLALEGAASDGSRIGRLVLRAFRHWPWALGLSLLPGLLLLLDLWIADTGGYPSALIFGGFLGGVFLMLLGFSLMLYRRIGDQLNALVSNNFGMCSGMAAAPEGESDSLTPWLHAKIQEVAGFEGRPLTFGDLWNAPLPASATGLVREGEPSIDLKMITTCLTHGRPYELPFQEKTLYFEARELGKLFPPDIVEWMVKHQRPLEETENGFDLEGWCPMPPAKDLPVVVATRMSLSFPGLISTVPLGKIDFERHLKKGEKRSPEPILFSDGGISSNFPIHFFDSLVPRWPTIAINLRQFREDPGDSRGKRGPYSIYVTRRSQDGLSDQWFRMQPKSSLGMLSQFLGSIVNVMQNWVDNSHLSLPGYRHRVVEIWQTKKEGGLNLDMPPEVIEGLSAKGRHAGRIMASRFATQPSEKHRLGWEDHRWTRYRSAMAALAASFDGLEFTVRNREEWDQMILREKDVPPLSYSFTSRKQAEDAMSATAGLLDAYDDWCEGSTGVDKELGPFRNPPHPRIKLGARAMNERRSSS